jgi:hypothetical protein
MPGRTDALIFLALIGALSFCACGGAPEGLPQDVSVKAAPPAAPASAEPAIPAAPPSAGQAMAGSGARITGRVLYTGAHRPA